MANMKEVSVERGENLTDLVGRIRLGCKRADDGAVTSAQYVRLSSDDGEAIYLVVSVAAYRGAVNGETTLTLARVVGDGFPPVAMLSSRSPAPCNVARATDAEVVGAVRLRALLSSDGVHLNPPTPRPTRATRDALRPVEFDAECAAPVAGRCGTRGQRFVAEELETVSILSPSEGAGEWAAATDATVTEPAPVTDAPSAEVAPAATDEPATEPAPVTDEPAATETETPAPKGKRRKG